MPTYTSLAVFLLSAISLVIASGFSLGAGMLVLGATVLLRPASPRPRLAAPDYLFIAALGFYFLLHVALNLIHLAPGREYDAPLRFLLAIPALLLLCTFPPRPGALWSGAAVGAIGAGLLSLWQWLAWGMDRPGGSTNPIQYGNISALLAVLSTYGLARALALGHGLRWKLLHATGVLMALVATLLSGSRGSWLALPLCAILAAYLLIRAGQARRLLKPAVLALAALAVLALLPHSPLTARYRQAVSEAGGYLHDADAQSSVGARLEMLRVGLYLAPRHLLLGFGKEGMMQAKQHMVEEGLASDSVAEHTHLHNEYLDALVKHGIPGLLAVLVLYLLPLRLFAGRAVPGMSIEARMAAGAGMMLMLSYLAFGLTQAFLTHNNGVMMFAFLGVILWSLARQQPAGPANTA
ncbi:Lipid A core--O-antigen ligase [Herbaspirillum sp. BH-1]|uniref:O-antigen ligase family protein n=1 Tax=Herbaspirillum sp. (strain BH-1) TaxID=2058884 RepID=UPI000C883002|nr:O-antigen ligase family protein [Herbaspirillum sp. BH-1]PLY57329.1 Lipid A core--O-antigen ligase [Herbaspirillum sp. BH-1]